MAESRVEVSMVHLTTGRRSSLADFFTRLIKEKPLGTIGATIALLLLIAAIFAPLIAPYGSNETHPTDSLSPPSAKYFLGTDNLGRDLLSRIIYGARISVIIGLAAPAIGTFISVIIGTVSGYVGGRFDLVVQRFVDGWMCFPLLILLMAIVSLVGTGLAQLIVILGIASGIGGSRVIRSAVIAIRENVYVEAAVAIGAPTRKILTRHVLPNIMAPVIILFSNAVPAVILAEASLSFLGLGIPPPTPSWGGMLSGSARSYMFLAPWLALWPGLALSMVVYGVNMFGDAVRDLLDPRLRGGVGRYSNVKRNKLTYRGRLTAGRPKKE